MPWNLTKIKINEKTLKRKQRAERTELSAKIIFLPLTFYFNDKNWDEKNPNALADGENRSLSKAYYFMQKAFSEMWDTISKNSEDVTSNLIFHFYKISGVRRLGAQQECGNVP